MGYGSRALQLLERYYQGHFPLLDDTKQQATSAFNSVSNEVITNVFQATT